MAEIYNIGAGLTFYDVSKAVGEGMPNNMDDVMLVQWLLKHHFERPDKRAMLGNLWSIPVINGVVGRMLIEIIKIYQYDANLNVNNADIAMDGRVYPIQACGGVNKSVMVYANFSMAGHFKKFYSNPKSDPIVGFDVKAMFDRIGGVAHPS
jgi:hypothetical protein